jgi:PhnB protein
MTLKAITPYLILNGKAEQAIALYVGALGATVEAKMRFGDVQPNCPDALKDSVMHAALRVGSVPLMLSDGGGDGSATTAGTNNVEVALDFSDVAEAHRCFDALGSGGKVREPLAAAPWGALFGALTDKFGIQWMFNVELKPA